MQPNTSMADVVRINILYGKSRKTRLRHRPICPLKRSRNLLRKCTAALAAGTLQTNLNKTSDSYFINGKIDNILVRYNG